MKEEIMQKINNKDIEMRPDYFFWAKKLALQSLLAFFVVCGALLLNSLFYFFKKTNTMELLSLGWSGVEKVLMSLPYDYISLFIITLVLANFIIHKFDLSRGIKMNSNIALVILLLMTIFLSAFFLINGIEDVMKFWDKNNIFEIGMSLDD